MPERDPSVDPRAGDTWKKKLVIRTVCGRTSNGLVICTEESVHDRGTVNYRPRPTLNQFRKWARNAEVVKRGN